MSFYMNTWHALCAGSVLAAVLMMSIAVGLAANARWSLVLSLRHLSQKKDHFLQNSQRRFPWWEFLEKQVWLMGFLVNRWVSYNSCSFPSGKFAFVSSISWTYFSFSGGGWRPFRPQMEWQRVNGKVGTLTIKSDSWQDHSCSWRWCDKQRWMCAESRTHSGGWVLCRSPKHTGPKL